MGCPQAMKVRFALTLSRLFSPETGHGPLITIFCVLPSRTVKLVRPTFSATNTTQGRPRRASNHWQVACQTLVSGKYPVPQRTGGKHRVALEGATVLAAAGN